MIVLTCNGMSNRCNGTRHFPLTQYPAIRLGRLRLFLFGADIRNDQALLNSLRDLHAVPSTRVHVQALALVKDAGCYGFAHADLTPVARINDGFDDTLLGLLNRYSRNTLV